MHNEKYWRVAAVIFIVAGSVFTTYHLIGLAQECPWLVFLGVLIALAFDFSNGVNDAANSIATIVSTRVLTPLQAVVWAAFFNFISAYIFGVHVAMTVAKGVVRTEVADTYVVMGGLVGAVLWTALCSYVGLPISCSHALIGGFAGAAVTKAGVGSIVAAGLGKIALFIVLSPAIGLVLGLGLSIALTWVFRRAKPHDVDHLFRKGQLLSAAAYSLGHGTNDAQKTMGIIGILLYSTVWKDQKFDEIPFWIVLMCHFAMGLGTLLGGWHVVKTMGSKITKLNPFAGFAAESGAAITLFATAAAGIPVSTTHTITGSIIGVGSQRGMAAVRWGVARQIVWAWVLTIPISALVGAGTYAALIFVARQFGA